MNFKPLTDKLKAWLPTREIKQKGVPVIQQSFHGWLTNIGRSDVAKTLAIIYYIKCYPVSSGITEISDRLKNIIPIFLDKNDETIENDATKFLMSQPIGDILNKMNVNYKATGEIFLMKSGITRIMSIDILASSKVSVIQGSDGTPSSFQYSSNSLNRTFSKNIEGRFFDSSGVHELVFYFEYHPNDDSAGLSPLSAVSLEIEQYMSSGTHNLANLTNSIKPSVVLSSKSDMIPNSEQMQQFKDLLDEFYTGSGNAGNYLVTGNFDVEQLGKQVDMDYKDLSNGSRNAILQKLGVPITIADTTASTFNNRQLDQLAFYDDTVIPLYKMYMGWLINTLQDDFKSTTEIAKITINETEISALSERALKNLERRSKIGHLSINELRQIDNRSEVVGGDIIYQPASSVPVASDEDLEDETVKQIEQAISLMERKDG